MTTRRLYALNAALLITHEIDSAFWHEWDLLHLPGGVAGFVLVHVPLVLLVLWGYAQVNAGTRAGIWMSLALATAGLVGLGVHGAFLACGGTDFRTPVSLSVLAAMGLVSITQGVVAIRSLRNGSA